MTEVICTVAGFMAGGIVGVVVMCVLQINTINKYERKIVELERKMN